MKRIVLCRPEGPRNVGAILRVALNFGPTEITLVNPLRASLLVHPDFVQMSHGAEAARDEIRVVDTLEEALADCTWAVGFSARVRGKRRRRDWRVLAPELAPRANDDAERLALVLGNEVTGLTEPEASLCQELVHLRTSREHTSLNLAMCAGVALSDLFTDTAVHQVERGGSMLDGGGREFLKAGLKQMFVGRVARTPAAARDIEAMIDRVFSRAPLENRDARAFHLILRALGSELEPTDLGLHLHEKDGRRKKLLARHGEVSPGERTPDAVGEAPDRDESAEDRDA